jgi:NADH:ubiquinone oxidoreductase subunit F (NADH-binding)
LRSGPDSSGEATCSRLATFFVHGQLVEPQTKKVFKSIENSMSVYSELQQAAQQRLQEETSGKTRILVQVGHCSQAVGALEVRDALRDALAGRSDAYLIIAGCDGACFAAPQVIVTHPSGATRYYSRVTLPDVADIIGSLSDDNSFLPGEELESFFTSQYLLVMSRCGQKDSTDIDEHIADGGYRGLDKALAQSPEQVIDEVLKSGLMGRGGAYFPPARKWQGARSVNASSRYIVVNAEEGEPGIFKDRHLMEGDPHRLLEGALIAAYASGASQIYIYINAEAHLSAERMEIAIEQARGLGLIGENILGSSFNCEAAIRRGAGGYVCGEETTLLNTIEGDRREPRLRPPFPTESGLFRQPTVINNVETLVNVPYILSRGASRFSQIGLDSARGTKLICLSGSVRRPGLAEVPMGATLRQVIYNIGGGPPPGRNIGVIAVGGPSSGVLPVSELDTPLRPGMLHPSGVVMGAGGVMVLDESVPVMEVVRRLAAYNAAESCGKCTPCREGTPRMVEALDRLASGHGSPNDLDELRYLAEIVSAASLCGLGQMSGGPINSALRFFGEEMARLAGVS